MQEESNGVAMFSPIGEGRESLGEQPEVMADTLEKSTKMPA